MSVYAFIFPGQGSQFVGMGADLAQAFAPAREVFQEVDDALGEHLSKIIFEGPAEALTSTENTQPALMAVSLAVLRVLEREGGLNLASRATLLAGHSLGEYSALAAGGALGVGQTAKLLRLRGQAMQSAVPAGKGGMVALVGATFEQAAAICAEAAVLRVEGEADKTEILEIANDNGGGQIVLSGEIGAIDRAVDVAKALGVRRAVKLPVSAPFHCSMMRRAADAMEEALERSEIGEPVVPLIANVTAAKITSPDAIRKALVEQVTGSVRWRESVAAMVGMGVDHFVELGAGKVLSGLVKRIDSEVSTVSVGTPGDIESFLKSF